VAKILYNTGSLQIGLIIMAHVSQMGNKYLGKCSKIGSTFKFQRWKNANSTDTLNPIAFGYFLSAQSYSIMVSNMTAKSLMFIYKCERVVTLGTFKSIIDDLVGTLCVS
jgi:hypothetical protein